MSMGSAANRTVRIADPRRTADLPRGFNLALFTTEAKNLGGDAGFALGGGQATGYATLVDGISQLALHRSQHRVHCRHQRLQGRVRHASRGVMQFVAKSGASPVPWIRL